MVAEQDNQEKAKIIWWLCVEYMQDRKQYAMGRYLQNLDQELFGILVDFKEVDSLAAAFCEALVKATQFAFEDFDCIESDLQIRTTSTKLVN